jgi:diaminopimelate epimerase
MQFIKFHGAGNDYLVIESGGVTRDWPSLVRRITDRHFGVGSDGLLLVEPSQVTAIRMRVFNPDGSEAEMSGDGIRCFTKYVLDQGIVQVTNGVLEVETGNGIRSVIPTFDHGKVVMARVDMGRPGFRADEVPLRLPEGMDTEGPLVDFPLMLDQKAIAVTCVSMGNPHAAAFIEEPVDQFPLESLGPQVEHHPLFPNRVNFEIANVVARDRLKMRTWERGTGETLACGTGACAVAVAAYLKGLTDTKVELELKGGSLKVEWDGVGSVWMEGPVEEVFQGEWKD